VDNNGETRKWLGGQAREYITGKMASQSYFENAGSVPKSITVIPYRLDKLHSGFVMKSSVRLNKEGTTTVPLNQDKNLTITKVFEKDGKTYLYYISDYPVNDYLPILLVDEDGIMHNRVLNESIKSPKGKESVLVFNESLLNKELKVFNPNTVYYDQAFTIEIK
jgi:N-acetylmuramoyl-L-alanine amidase CwlA